MSNVQTTTQSNGRVLPDLTAAATQEATLRAEIAALKAQLESRPAGKLTLKVGAKGGVSVFGINSRFPVTLYAAQWERLAAFMPELIAFVKAHPELARK